MIMVSRCLINNHVIKRLHCRLVLREAELSPILVPRHVSEGQSIDRRAFALYFFSISVEVFKEVFKLYLVFGNASVCKVD